MTLLQENAKKLIFYQDSYCLTLEYINCWVFPTGKITNRNTMKKVTAILLISILGIMSASALACPKGQHPHGGTGSHHKGGYCSFD